MNALFAVALFCVCVFFGNGKAGALRVRKRVLSAMEEDIRRLADQLRSPCFLHNLNPELKHFGGFSEKNLAEKRLWQIFGKKQSWKQPKRAMGLNCFALKKQLS